MKYINQLEYPHWLYVTKTEEEDPARRESGKTTTVKGSGCGLCSAVMVADRLIPECDFDLADAIYSRFAPAFAEKMAFDLERTDDPDRLLFCLRTGGAAVINVGGDREGHIGVFSHGGHYIVAIGEERDGRIAILDPSYKEGKFEEEGRKGLVEMKNGVVALCDLQVLVDDTANRSPAFSLFWRK